jgi:hypothetical protein
MKVSRERLRPFSSTAKVRCRSYSRRMQRVITDFGADSSFHDTQKKIVEHYSLEIPTSSIQAIVENHAKNIFDFIETESFEEGTAKQLVSETDGCMVPVVDTLPPKGEKKDRRKCRKVRYAEARLCFSRGAQQITPMFYATMGDVDRTGDLLFKSALRVGFGPNTKVHGLGDGAKWIEEQMHRVFGIQAEFLIDFFHTSEYLAEAAEHSWASEKEAWRREQQELLKKNQYQVVLEALRRRLPENWVLKKPKKTEASNEAKVADTPVEKCYRYIHNRKHCLNYKGAIEKELPIGSGEVESSHRYVIQKRLKIAGAWWKPSTAENMLALRTLRANGDWGRYWGYALAA